MEYKKNTVEELINVTFKEFNEDFQRTIFPVTVFVIVETCFGFIGNLFVINVFLCKYRTCTFRNFVLCLTFINLFSCITTMPGEVYSHYNYYTFKSNVLCKTRSACNVLTLFGEIFCLFAIAVYRFRKICRPFQWQIKQKTTVLLGTLIYIASAILAVPEGIFEESMVDSKLYQGFKLNVTICATSVKWRRLGFIQIVLLSFVAAVILLLTVFLYVSVYVRLRTLNKCVLPQPAEYKTIYPYIESGIKSDKTPGTNESSRTGAFTVDHVQDKDTLIKHQETPPDNIEMEEEAVLNIERQNYHKDARNKYESIKYNKTHTERTKTNSIRWKDGTKRSDGRWRRNTKIMFLLTVLFLVTGVCFFAACAYSYASNSFSSRNNTEEALYIFFKRLYFINYVLHPVVYALLDPSFRHVLLRC